MTDGNTEVDELPRIPKDVYEKRFPGGFHLRDEANAIVAYAFRNGPIEDLHAGEPSELLTNKRLSRLTDEGIKTIMIFACDKVEELLRLKLMHPDEYLAKMVRYNINYCRGWKR